MFERIEGLDIRAEARRRRQLSRLDAGCVRFLPHGLRPHAMWRRSSARTSSPWRSAITLTLAMRPLGAFIFGMLADRFGRAPGADGRHPALSRARACDGLRADAGRLPDPARAVRIRDGRRVGHRRVADDGDDPGARARLVSGIAATGYASAISWRRSCTACCSTPSAGAACSWSASRPRCSCSTSAATCRNRRRGTTMRTRPRRPLADVLRSALAARLYAMLLMTAFNFFSHGTQDLYPTFLQVAARASTAHGEHHRDHREHRRDHRRLDLRRRCRSASDAGARSSSAALLALPLIPLWAYSHERARCSRSAPS